MHHNIKQAITHLPQDLHVGLSGGLDSVVLLDALVKAEFNVIAVHVNHNLSPNAFRWQKFCEGLCSKLQVKIIVHSVNISNKSNIEEQARNARLKIWQEYKYICLAHHLQDQTETLLYRLFRGTGIRGLGGMQEKRDNILRPLLNIPKLELEEYAKEHSLEWIIDESNLDLKFDRNFIRHEVLPLIKKRWPKADASIAKLAAICTANTEFVNHQLKHITGETLKLADLEILDDYLKLEAIRLFIERTCDYLPSHTELDIIINEVIKAREDSLPVLKLDSFYLTRYNKTLYLLDFYPHIKPQHIVSKEWDLKNDLVLPDGRVLKADILQGFDSVTVKFGQYGKKVKKIFQKNNIPPWERDKYPIIFKDSKFVVVAFI